MCVVRRVKADGSADAKWIAVLHREAASQLPVQLRLLEAALSAKPELQREFQAEMLRLNWADRMDAWQQRAKALEAKLGRGEVEGSEVREINKEYEALRCLLATFWFRNLGFKSLLVERRPRLWSSHIYTYHKEFNGKGGKLEVFSPEVDRQNFRTVFDAGEGRIHRYDLSFDGREIVFAWQKNAAEPYQICRIHVDGTGLTQLTSGPSHNYNPCWLPDGGIAFISTRNKQWAVMSTGFRRPASGGTSPTSRRSSPNTGERSAARSRSCRAPGIPTRRASRRSRSATPPAAASSPGSTSTCRSMVFIAKPACSHRAARKDRRGNNCRLSLRETCDFRGAKGQMR